MLVLVQIREGFLRHTGDRVTTRVSVLDVEDGIVTRLLGDFREIKIQRRVIAAG